MYRISVTNIEKFRRYLAEASPYDTQQAVIDGLLGRFEGNPKTVTGSAYHKLIENPYHPSIKGMEIGGYEYVVVDNIAFPEEAALQGVAYYRKHPLMVYEVDVKKPYHTSYGPVLVSGRVDGLEGKRVNDTKTKFRPVDDLSEYLDSVQWRYYLDILGCDLFHYNLFEMKRFKSFAMGEHKTSIIVQDELEVIAHEPIVCYRYINMHHDCLHILDKFMEFIHTKGLQKYLKRVDPVTHQTIFSTNKTVTHG